MRIKFSDPNEDGDRRITMETAVGRKGWVRTRGVVKKGEKPSQWVQLSIEEHLNKVRGTSRV